MRNDSTRDQRSAPESESEIPDPQVGESLLEVPKHRLLVEKGHLMKPRGMVDFDRQDVALEPDRPRMCRDELTHHFAPMVLQDAFPEALSQPELCHR